MNHLLVRCYFFSNASSRAFTRYDLSNNFSGLPFVLFSFFASLLIVAATLTDIYNINQVQHLACLVKKMMPLQIDVVKNCFS